MRSSRLKRILLCRLPWVLLVVWIPQEALAQTKAWKTYTDTVNGGAIDLITRGIVERVAVDCVRVGLPSFGLRKGFLRNPDHEQHPGQTAKENPFQATRTHLFDLRLAASFKRL